MTDAVVIGSGPNGLAAAVRLAQAGLRVLVVEGADEIGGGTRSAELTVPGLLHDVCSAVHPFGAASPFLSSLPLADFGLHWRRAEVDVVHPLADGSAGVLHQSLEMTVLGMGADGARWKSVFGPLVDRADALVADGLGPLLRLPSHPLAMARLGLRAGLPATALVRLFRTEGARALFMGCAAHLYRPLNGLASASVGTMMIAAGHRWGWPVAQGGSAAISRALAGLLESLGGEIVTGVTVRSLNDVPRAAVTMFDTTPEAVTDITGDRMPARRAKAYRQFRHAPAAFKADFAVRGGIPWVNEHARRAGTVHLGGSAADIARSESSISRGVMPENSFQLIGQQYLADPSRSVGDVHPVWTYAHVPHAYPGDASELLIGQIEELAPGFRDRIVAQHLTSPRQLQDENPNYVGGDIVGGRNDLLQVFARPVPARNGYATGIPGMYLCSASTPPGAGAHGMCGYHAATSALEYLRGLKR
ncbi:phytoene desaturase family protein [Mycolicibacterium hodleri]|uniref:phytoene desaturase family protein n=1 Tax=Mycolicibacterium hodleri TaxID=49897 RepID=UPI001476AA7F|nr:NAD(P)/FAD-dependent oxidoreductase [Mycolicibacterium hodleri]